jgi:hypothetical protein
VESGRAAPYSGFARAGFRAPLAEPGVRLSLRTGLSIDVDAKSGVFCQASWNNAYDLVVEGESYRPRLKPAVTGKEQPPSVPITKPDRPVRRRKR